MSSGFFVARDSAIHGLHPVTKIVALGLAFAAALLLDRPLDLTLLGLFFALIGSRAGALASLRRVGWLLVLVALASFGIWSLAYAGKDIVAGWGPFTVTREGMSYGAAMGLRLALLAFAGLIFLAATRIEDVTYGLTRLGLPFAVSFALTLSFRLVPLFSDTVRAIADAQRARGLDPAAGGLAARTRSFIPMIAPVFAGALRRADQLAVALESKGFGLDRRRGSLRVYSVGAADAAALVVMTVVTALAAAARLFART
jgi:energy-coupling factor transport system permease protein